MSQRADLGSTANVQASTGCADEQCIDLAAGDADLRQFRRALGRFATGITVITTRAGDKLEGLTANSFSSVSLEPPLVLWSLQAGAPSLTSFRQAGRFAINVLSAGQQLLSNHFATRALDKFTGIDYVEGQNGCPILKGCLASFECTLVEEVRAGDHIIFIGRVERAIHRDGEPLLFNCGSYCVPKAVSA